MADIKNLNLRIDENGLLAEIEVNDFYAGGVDPERDAHNEKFMEEEVKGTILKHFTPCMCQLPKMQERALRRLSIINPRPGQVIALEPEQEDLDNYNFSACVISKDGYMQRMSFYIRECKTCRKVEYAGDIHTLTDLFAEATAKQVSAEYMAEPVPEDLVAKGNEVVDQTEQPPLPAGFQSAEDVLGPNMFIEDINEPTTAAPTEESSPEVAPESSN